MEGNADLQTELKYREKVKLDPRPVIICCNRDIWSDCQSYARPCQSRMVNLRFRCPVPAGLSLYNAKPILRKALERLHHLYSNGEWEPSVDFPLNFPNRLDNLRGRVSE